MLAQAPGSMPNKDNARLALPAKLPTPPNQAVSGVTMVLCEASMLTEPSLQPVLSLLMPLVLAQAPGSMPNKENARLAPPVKMPTTPNQAVSGVLTEQCAAIPLDYLTPRAGVFAISGSMPNKENATIVQKAKLVILAIPAVSGVTMVKCEALMLTEPSLQPVSLPQVLAQKAISMPNKDNARLALTSKLPTPPNQAVFDSNNTHDMHEAKMRKRILHRKCPTKPETKQ